MRTIMRVVWRVLLLGLVAATPAPRAQMPPLEVLLRQFEQIAFRHEFGGVHRQGRLIKWTHPIRVAIRGRGASAYKDEVRRQLAQLSLLTGLKIELISWYATGAPDIEVHFVHPGRGQRINRNSVCAAHVFESNYVLHRAKIFITASIPRLRRHCIAEEITQALGLTNDSTVLRDSIFNDWSHQLYLSPADELMVRTLYDRRMRPGMPLPQAMYFARIIMTEILYGRRRGPKPYRR